MRSRTEVDRRTHRVRDEHRDRPLLTPLRLPLFRLQLPDHDHRVTLGEGLDAVLGQLLEARDLQPQRVTHVLPHTLVVRPPVLRDDAELAHRRPVRSEPQLRVGNHPTFDRDYWQSHYVLTFVIVPRSFSGTYRRYRSHFLTGARTLFRVRTSKPRSGWSATTPPCRIAFTTDVRSFSKTFAHSPGRRFNFAAILFQSYLTRSSARLWGGDSHETSVIFSASLIYHSF